MSNRKVPSAVYRKLCQEYYGYSDEDMSGMDVHHIDGDKNNNNPDNLRLVSPEEHAKLHESEFPLWARKGNLLSRESLRRRLAEHGQTEKEILHQEKLSILRSNGLHRVPHSEESKRIISEKKKELLKDKSNHPMWGNTTYKVTDPNGNIYYVSGGWKDWCEERGLSNSNMTAVANGKRKHSKGWIAEYYDRNSTNKKEE
jgi:hypothetical protein